MTRDMLSMGFLIWSVLKYTATIKVMNVVTFNSSTFTDEPIDV